MNRSRPLLIALAALAGAASARASVAQPGCERLDAQRCLALSMQAMGGHDRLAHISSVRLDVAQHSLLVEQSYRQAPFIAAYDRLTKVLDFSGARLLLKDHGLWPEADPDSASAESDTTVVATKAAAIVRSDSSDSPAGPAQVDAARMALELGPERLLLTAEAAPDLHFEAPEMLRSTPHAVVAFHWRDRPVRVLLNTFNHLPDAVEITQQFNDFWFVWGDVDQRIYFDNWKLIGGVVYPTNRVDERNGVAWSSSQVLDVAFNVALDDKALAMDPAAAAKSARSKGWNRTFDDSDHLALAPGVDLYQGAWNVTLIKQDDGVVVLEVPISPTFTAGVLDKARHVYPSDPIKAVLSTSDSWPHVAGVREAVAEKLPVYILDLNRPLLDRMIAAPHLQNPDHLQSHPQAPRWTVVSGKVEIGAGANRLELYPLRGAATERQYMVYFPEHRLLYASDTLVIDPKAQKVYDPELTSEVIQAVEREHLRVDTVYAMHQAPAPWSEVTRMVAAATTARPSTSIAPSS